MTTRAAPQTPSRPLASWLRASWLGWLLGVPCIIALALAGEAVGIGGSQALVGAGMGTGVGLLQGRAIGRLQLRPTAWLASSAFGLALPFLVTDVAHALGVNWTYSLPVCVALGGAIVGSWQALLLRTRWAGAGWWIVGSVVGWSLGGGTAALADGLLHAHTLRGLSGAGAFLGIIALGGLPLGIATGTVLVRGLRPRG